MADLRKQPRTPDDRFAGPAERGARQDWRLRRRSAGATTTVISASSRRPRPSRCARFSSTCLATARRSTSAVTRRRARRPIKIRERALAGESFEKLAADISDAPSRANAGLIGPLTSERCVARSAEAARADEGGRRQRGPACGQGLPDSEARIDHGPRNAVVRAGASRISATVSSPTSARRSSTSTSSGCAHEAIIEWKNAT